jgi:conjugative transfer signal peptidase TraF
LRRVTNRTILALIAAGAALAALAIASARAGDLILYNHSPSLPVGLYWRVDAPPERAAIVTVLAAAVAPEEARARHFDSAGDRFIKRVAATGGDLVCVRDGVVTINGARAAVQHESTSDRRHLEAWQDCRVFNADEILLLGDTYDSFDGRYWGPVERSQIEGVWRPLF